jgi:hypothetical protein
MNRLLLTAFLTLTVLFAQSPISAQRSDKFKNAFESTLNPVRYASAAAFSDGRGVWIKWQTENETENLGFYVYRAVGGRLESVSQSLIAGAYLQARENKITSGTYTFFDPLGDADSVYAIESLNINNQTHLSDLIAVQPVRDLTAVAGATSEQLAEQASDAEPVLLEKETVLPRSLTSEIERTTLPPNPIRQRWVAAQPGAKIAVKKEGFYRVSRAALQANGFDVNQPTSVWQLYSNGVEQAILVGDAGEYIEFYGRGIDTPNADAQTYFLVAGTENGKRIGSGLRTRIGASVVSKSYAQSFSKKERLLYSSSMLNGDAENFFGTVLGNAGGTINFDLTGVDFTQPTASIAINIQGLTQGAHETKVFLNTTEIGVITGSNLTGMSRTFTIPTALLREGANALLLKSQNGTTDISVFSSLKIDYAREYIAEGKQLSFYVPNYKLVYAKGFTSPNIRVFDTTNADTPILIRNLTIEPDNGGLRVVLPSNRSRVLFAVEDSATAAPDSIKPNAASMLSTAAHNADLIIVTYKDWTAQANGWANYRRAQGLTVEVVNVEDIFDEFSYGVTDPDAIRSFLQYAKNNWQTAPNYVLFLGDATYDPKNYLGNGNNNFVPTRLVDTVYTETGSDETLADFNDDGLAELAVGRIPARDAATVTLALNKLTNFEQTVGQGLNRGVLFVSDFPDGYDFQALSTRLSDQLPAGIPRTMINRGQANASSLLMTELNAGRFLVNYSGHGATAAWATNAFFSGAQASELTNTDKLSIFTMLTCLNGYFVSQSDSLSEFLLKNPNGGAVATWASTGLTTSGVQELMATRFYNQIAAGNITRMGDLIKDAKQTINSGRDVRLSWVLIGDPMMKVK